MRAQPYRYTSDDVIFEVFATRTGIPRAKRGLAREAFFSKPQACLRASDLCKRYGWGIHHDSHGRIAVYPVDSSEYAAFVSGARTADGGNPIVVKYGLRSKR